MTCDNEGQLETTVYADGVRRERMFPSGTRFTDTEQTQPVCERWIDANGSEFVPGDPSAYVIAPVPADLMAAARNEGF